MHTPTLKDLEREAKGAEKVVQATEKLIHDLRVQASIVKDDETLKPIETRIAKLHCRLIQEKEALAQSQARLRQVKSDFQRFGERNTL